MGEMAGTNGPLSLTPAGKTNALNPKASRRHQLVDEECLDHVVECLCLENATISASLLSILPTLLVPKNCCMHQGSWHGYQTMLPA